MDKNAIKKYAVWARCELISRVTQKALQYGITNNEIVPADASNVNGVVLTAQQKKERQALIAKINAEGFEQVMEEVAYTWFNRFSALRFMEVNGYLPTHVRVFTDEENRFKPQILAEAINLEIEGLDMEKVYALKDANDNDALFKYLIITQCNALSAILPRMFQKIDDYTELLFPDNLLREGSVIEQMIALIPEGNWNISGSGQVEIIGWLYQYYNTEQNELVYDGTLSKSHIEKELVPAATTIYTPDWAVRYMVENSLGRLWVEGHPNKELEGNWKYYLNEAEQEANVKVKLAEIRKEYAALQPEDIRCIDPCSGSGHILSYLFDVLVQIYETYGYTAREAVASIVENNIYGLDIDERASQLAYFSVMMKARQYDRRFFSRGIQPNVYAIVESNHVDDYTVEYFANGDAKLTKAIKTIIEELNDAKEYGSILTVIPQDWNAMNARFDEIYEESNISREPVLNELLPLVNVARVMAQKYDVIVTNPPYLGFNRFDERLNTYVTEHYNDVKADLSSVMFKHTIETMCKNNGFVAFITTSSWLFLSSFECFRKNLVSYSSFDSIVDYGSELFDGKVGHNQITSWVTRKTIINYRLTAIRLVDFCYSRRDEKEPEYHNLENRYYTLQDSFKELPGNTISYWASEKQAACFEKGRKVEEFAFPKQGIATADNKKYLRFWYEVDVEKCFFDCNSHRDSESSPLKWYPYNKGGGYKKWFGNNEYLINWQHDGTELRSFEKSVIRSPQYYFLESGSWCKVTSGNFSMRYIPKGFLFDVAGCSLFDTTGYLRYMIGYMNSVVNKKLLSLISPTMNFEVGHVGSLPIIESEEKEYIESIVENNIEISKSEWDSFETSWDFEHHPLILSVLTLSEAFSIWSVECTTRFNQLKANEEELNRIFIDIYGLQDELKPEVADNDVTVRRADLQRDVKSLISYAVGCMFGRYSLDEAGLVYAGGNWDESKYKIFAVDSDNIIPICDDEYFDDDITGLFVKFVETVYGKDTLDENLRFIADVIGGRGTSKEVIRNYFLNDFFADHCKIYQKRPIYWLFDSGKKNGFKALIYMHRYQPDTIARIRTDYVHEQQGRYRTAMADLEQRIDSASTSERVKLTKQLKSLQDQSAEIYEYEEKIHHLADQYISIDLDDGVKHNYEIFKDALSKIK